MQSSIDEIRRRFDADVDRFSNANTGQQTTVDSDRATERIGAAGGKVEMVAQSDIRETRLEREHYDVVVAAAVLHHLRSRDEWHRVLESIYASLRPGGSFWIWDLIRHENPGVEAVQRERYREYLTGLRDVNYAQGVFDYIEREDTPESVSFIVEAMVRTGFATVDVVHKNSMFAAGSGIR